MVNIGHEEGNEPGLGRKGERWNTKIIVLTYKHFFVDLIKLTLMPLWEKEMDHTEKKINLRESANINPQTEDDDIDTEITLVVADDGDITEDPEPYTEGASDPEEGPSKKTPNRLRLSRRNSIHPSLYHRHSPRYPSLYPSIHPSKNDFDSSGEWDSLSVSVLDLACQLLVSMHSHFKREAPDMNLSQNMDLSTDQSQLESKNPGALPQLPEWLQVVIDITGNNHPVVTCLGVRTFLDLVRLPPNEGLSDCIRREVLGVEAGVCLKLASCLWNFFVPEQVIVHYRAASLFSELKDLCGEVCEDVITRALTAEDVKLRVSVGFQRFSLLWRLTGERGDAHGNYSGKNLMQMLDSLDHELPMVRLTCRTWLADSLTKVERILDPLLKILFDPSTELDQNHHHVSEFDCNRVLYVFKKLQSLIDCDFQSFMKHVIQKPLSKDILKVYEQREAKMRKQDQSNEFFFTLMSDTNKMTSPLVKLSDVTNEPITGVTIISESRPNRSRCPPLHVTTYLDLLVVAAMQFISGRPGPSSGDDGRSGSGDGDGGGGIRGRVRRSSSKRSGGNVGGDGNTNRGRCSSGGNVDGDGNTRDNVGDGSGVRNLRSRNTSTRRRGNSVEGNNQPSHTFIEKLLIVQTSSATFLQYLLSKITDPPTATNISLILQLPVLLNLADTITATDTTATGTFVLQAQLLGLLRTILLYDNTEPAGEGNTNPVRPTRHLDALLGEPIFLETLIAGILQPNSDFNVRFYWAEFIISCLPLCSEEQIANFVMPIISCFCNLLSTSKGIYDSIGSKDIIMVLKTMAIIINFVLFGSEATIIPNLATQSLSQGQLSVQGQSSGSSQSQLQIITDQDQTQDLSNSLSDDEDDGWSLRGLFPYIGLGKLGARSHNQSSSDDTRRKMLEQLPRIIEVMIYLWGPPSTNNKASTLGFSRFSKDQLHNRYALQDLIINILEPIMEQFPTTMIKSFLHRWLLDKEEVLSFIPTPSNNAANITTRNVLSTSCGTSDPLVPSAPLDLDKLEALQEKLVIIEILNTMESATPSNILQSAKNVMLFDKEPKKMTLLSNHIIPDFIVMDFVRLYLDEFQGDHLLAVSWSALLQLMHKSLSMLTTTSVTVISTTSEATLLLFYVLGSFVKKAGPVPDGRIFRHLQDYTGRLLDAICSIASNGATGEPLPAEADEGQTARAERMYGLSYKAITLLSAKLPLILAVVFKGRSMNYINSAVNLVVHTVIPLVQSRNPFQADLSLQSVRLFHSLCRMKFGDSLRTIAISTWQRNILNLFYEADFFKIELKQVKVWSLVMNRIVKSDTTIFGELIKTLAHVLAHPSTNGANSFFLGAAKAREENLNRARHLKRLAFLIFSGEHDQYLEHLPVIQEKLVEALKAKGDPETISHLKQYVFLVMRVILLRCTHKKVDSFWPMVLTEMMDVYEDHTDDPQLVTAVTKFMDLALELPTGFTLWQWIFLEDPFVPKRGGGDVAPGFVPYFERFAMKKEDREEIVLPKYIKQRSLISFDSLNNNNKISSFLANFSLQSYQNSTSRMEPDYQNLEQLLLMDFCERD